MYWQTDPSVWLYTSGVIFSWSCLCQCVSPHHHEPACACEGITTENRFQVPSDVFTLTEHKVLVCLNLLKNEASQNIISPVWRPGTWVALMVCHAGRTDLENNGCPVRPFSWGPPGTAPLNRQTGRARKKWKAWKKKKRIDVYSSETRQFNVFTSAHIHISFPSSKQIIFFKMTFCYFKSFSSCH